MNIPKRVEDRFKSTLKQYVDVLTKQLDRDVSEADTVTIVKDLLNDLFGYDKYAELTSELAIRGTYCDLAIRLDGKPRLLIEVKAIGLSLNEKHTKQAVDYAANQGLEWVVLTNGVRWILYHVLFKKPIEQTVVAELDLLATNLKNDCDLEKLYLLSKEGFVKGAMSEYRERKDATSRFAIAAILLNSDDILKLLRREIRRVSGVMIEQDAITQVLRDEVIKREALEGDRADHAQRKVSRRSDRSLRNEPSHAADPSDSLEIPEESANLNED